MSPTALALLAGGSGPRQSSDGNYWKIQLTKISLIIVVEMFVQLTTQILNPENYEL
jgi:hypothetical protein